MSIIPSIAINTPIIPWSISTILIALGTEYSHRKHTHSRNAQCCRPQIVRIFIQHLWHQFVFDLFRMFAMQTPSTLLCVVWLAGVMMRCIRQRRLLQVSRNPKTLKTPKTNFFFDYCHFSVGSPFGCLLLRHIFCISAALPVL